MSQFQSHITENVKFWTCSGPPTSGSYCGGLNSITSQKCGDCGKERGDADYAKDENAKTIGTFEANNTVMYMPEFEHSLEVIDQSTPEGRLAREVREAKVARAAQQAREARTAREAGAAHEEPEVTESTKAEYERSKQGEGSSRERAIRLDRDRQRMPPPPLPVPQRASSSSAESSRSGSKRKHSSDKSGYRK